MCVCGVWWGGVVVEGVRRAEKDDQCERRV